MLWLIDIAALMVIPTVLLSFWLISQRGEFSELKASGQKISLNISSLFAGYQRPIGDPLRGAHIRLARIAVLHWAMMMAGFAVVFIAGMALLLQP